MVKPKTYQTNAQRTITITNRNKQKDNTLQNTEIKHAKFTSSKRGQQTLATKQKNKMSCKIATP